MNEMLVYDAARDGGGGSLFSIATWAIVAGFVLMAVPTALMVVRQPEKRARGLVGLAAIAVIAVVAVFELPRLTAGYSLTGPATTIEGTIESVSPKLIRVGLMKVMVSCSDATSCPGVRPGDKVRVEFIDDSGPETDALATHIWKRIPG